MQTSTTAQQVPPLASAKVSVNQNLALTLPPVDFLAVCFVRAMFAGVCLGHALLGCLLALAVF